MKKLLLIITFLVITLSTFAQNLQISGGNSYSLSICSDGKVYAWGENNSGQLGIPASATFTTVPVSVTGPGFGSIVDLKQVDAGSGNHAVAVDCQGRVWAWGADNCSQLGRGAALAPNGGTCGCCEESASGGTGIPATVSGIGTTLPPAVYVSGGNTASYAITTITGEVLAWGSHNFGQLGDGSTPSNANSKTTPVYVLTAPGVRLNNIAQIEGGDKGAYALDRTGYVWSWGYHEGGNKQLGRNLGAGSYPFAGRVLVDCDNDGTQDGPLGSCLTSVTGTSIGSGVAISPTNTALISLLTSSGIGVKRLEITQISVGDTHGLAMDIDGNVWSWGGNWAQGQLGNGASYTPNDWAQRVNAPGNCGTNSGRPTPPYLTRAKFIAAGQASSAVVLDIGTTPGTRGLVATFGSNGFYAGPTNGGVLGTGDATPGTSALCPVFVRTNATTTLTGMVSVSDGDAWYFALDINGNLFGWGSNNRTSGNNARGTIGDGTNTDRTFAIPITPPCVLSQSCATKPNLGSDLSLCPNYSLLSDVVSNVYSYGWQYRATSTTPSWTTVSSGTGSSFTTYNGTSIGQYRLLISDTRTAANINCGSCPVVGDTITFGPPACSSNPNLGPDLQVCQPVSQVLNSNISGASLIFRWEYSAASSTTGFSVLATGTGLNTILGSNLGFYRVGVIGNTSCTGCIPSGTDIILLSVAPSVFNAGPSSICTTVGGSGVFTITTTAGGGAYFWYTNPTGGVALNTVAGLSISGISNAQTSTLSGCTGRVLYVDDQSSFNAILNSTTSGTNTQLCSSYGSAIGGNRVPTVIQVNQNVSLTSLAVRVPNDGNARNWNLRVQVFNQTQTVAAWCGSCSVNIPWIDSNNGSPAQSADFTVTYPANFGPANQVITMSGLNLTPGRYWIRVVETNSNAQAVLPFSCTPTLTCSGQNAGLMQTPLLDNSGNNVVAVLGGGQDNPCSGATTGAIFQMNFQAGAVSLCNRIPVCATATCPLSVSYADFYGVKNNNTVDLNWSTISEQNASHFIIERSNDGLTFTPIGTVKAKGNSNSFVKYTFNDPKPGRGTVYYRLVQYDFDNSYYISKVISINSTVLNEFTVVPNPNNGNFTVIANLNSSTEFTLKVINSLGVTLSSSNERTDGSFTKDFNLSALAAGVYYISFKAGDDYIVKKVMIE